MDGASADCGVGGPEAVAGDFTFGSAMGRVLVISLSVGLLLVDGLTVTSVPVGDAGSSTSWLSGTDSALDSGAGIGLAGSDGLRNRSRRAA